MMLDFEAEDGEAEKEGSLFDILTEGLVDDLGAFPSHTSLSLIGQARRSRQRLGRS